ncbi:MAG TPA: RidA family protein [Thermoanaerobaculia bacterium]|nr:RidA family protein [Thermoanaerobaculia bacterium]
MGALLIAGAWATRDHRWPRGRALLAAAWGFTVGLGYCSVFLHWLAMQAGELDPAPIPTQWVFAIKVFGTLLAVVALAFTLVDTPMAAQGHRMSRQPMKKDYLNPTGLPSWSDSFSQVVVVRSGSMRAIYVSGQVAVDASHNVVGRGDLGRQAELALENLRRALAAAGATPADVVRLGIYIKDYQPGQASVIGDALRRVFAPGRMPASTWLGVSALALDELLIEIEAEAITDASEG